MIIDVRSEKCVYITIGDWIYYIDDSTDEQIMDKWKKVAMYHYVNGKRVDDRITIDPHTGDVGIGTPKENP